MKHENFTKIHPLRAEMINGDGQICMHAHARPHTDTHKHTVCTHTHVNMYYLSTTAMITQSYMLEERLSHVTW